MPQEFLFDIPDVGGAGRNKTLVYLPDSFRWQTGRINMVLYMHGLRAPIIEKYFLDPDYQLKKIVRDCGKNVAFVAPNLGVNCEAGILATDPTRYITKVLYALSRELNPNPDPNQPDLPFLPGKFILSAHSGGGWVMLQVFKNINYKIQECWGFDCLYLPEGNKEAGKIYDPRPYDPKDPSTMPPPYTPEVLWAESGAALKVFYLGTVVRSENLKKLAAAKGNANITVEKSSSSKHETVPKAHLGALIAAAGLP